MPSCQRFGFTCLVSPTLYWYHLILNQTPHEHHYIFPLSLTPCTLCCLTSAITSCTLRFVFLAATSNVRKYLSACLCHLLFTRRLVHSRHSTFRLHCPFEHPVRLPPLLFQVLCSLSGRRSRAAAPAACLQLRDPYVPPRI